MLELLLLYTTTQEIAMRILIKQTFLLLFLIICAVHIQAQKLDHILGEIIVEVRDESGMKSLLQDLSKDAEVRSSLTSQQIIKEPMNLWLIKVNPNVVNERKFLNSVLKNKHALLAQQNHISQLRQSIPNDPLFESQWQYINTGQSGGMVGADIDMELAWDIATGGLTTDGDTIVVCVIDDGINPNHPDLGDNLWVNHQEIPNNGIDDDDNGYIDDVRGWSAYSDSDEVYQGGSHGTPVAGIVGAQGNNEVGVSGVNWDVKLMIVRGGSPEATALASYAYPYTMRKLYNETNGEKGAFVVSTNASWGVDFGDPDDAPIWCDFYNILGEEGILNFGATINGNTNVDVAGDLPTACESNYLVSVTNINRNDDKVTSAGYGLRTIDLGAHGASTYTLTSSAYGGFGGTSGATPHVAGTAALLYSAECPDFTALMKADPAQAALVIKDCILHGVDPNTSLAGITTTGGRLNVNNAIRILMSTCDDCTSALGSDVSGITDVKGTLTWYDNGNLGTTSMRYKELNAIDWIEVENLTSGYEFPNLVACSAYEYQTKTICDSNPDADYTYSRVFETDGCCETPTGISIEVDNQSATLSWEDILAASNFIVEWKNINDTDWIVVNLGNNNTHTIEGILDCEFYEIRVKSECEATSNSSEFSEIFNVNGDCGGCTREFCTFGEKDISDEWIESVEIENVFLNQSGVNMGGYGNFLGQFDINLTQGGGYVLNLTPGYSGNSFNEFFSAYIDFNQDGEFGDDEAIFISEQSTDVAVSGEFTIPTDAVLGIARMRVIMRFNTLNGPCDAGGFDYGEVEEYCVNIIENTGCPSEITASLIDFTDTTLTFEMPTFDLIQNYILLYKEETAQSFDTIISESEIIKLENLPMCMVYNYRTGFTCDGMTFIDDEIFEAKTLCVLSSEEENELQGINIYPNPSLGDLYIDFESPIRSTGKIELLTSSGRKIIAQQSFGVGETLLTLDVQQLPDGIYFLKIKSEGQFVVKKWVKY